MFIKLSFVTFFPWEILLPGVVSMSFDDLPPPYRNDARDSYNQMLITTSLSGLQIYEVTEHTHASRCFCDFFRAPAALVPRLKRLSPAERSGLSCSLFFSLFTLEPEESNFHALLSWSNPTSLQNHWACGANPYRYEEHCCSCHFVKAFHKMKPSKK